MRRSTEALLTVTGLIAIPLGVVVFHYARLPLQPKHPAIARVVAIKAWEAKFRAARDTVVIRNAHGTGQFTIREAELRCRIGDMVPVMQRGVTLTAAPKTCR